MNQLKKTIDTKEGVSRPKNWLKRNKTQFEILGMSLPGAILLLLFCIAVVWILSRKPFVMITDKIAHLV